jgi:hypothetical protein
MLDENLTFVGAISGLFEGKKALSEPVRLLSLY